MRKSFYGLFALAGLGLMTSLATSAALGDRKRGPSPTPKAAIDVQAPAPVPAKFRAGNVMAAAAAGLDPSTVSNVRMSSLHVEAAGNILHVAGQAHILDKRPNVTYIWSFRVLEPGSKTPLWQRAYAHQAFTPPAGVEVGPTFEDKLELPLKPGPYLAQLAVYELPIGAAPAILDDPKVAEGQVACLGQKKFKIAR